MRRSRNGHTVSPAARWQPSRPLRHRTSWDAVSASPAAVRRRCRRDAPRWEVESGRAQRTPASGKGLVFSPESFLQDQLVERQLRNRPLEPAVLLLHFPETLGLVELQTAVLAPPAIIALLRDAEAPTDRANRLTCL